ncbi:hypothetical protein O5698_00620 [Escherichia coli]|nr:hypothetical protein [Escherichia coli]
MQGNVTIDEAAFHEKLDELLKAVLPLKTWGGKIRLISTHDGVDNLFNQLIQESRAGKKITAFTPSRWTTPAMTGCTDVSCQGARHGVVTGSRGGMERRPAAKYRHPRRRAGRTLRVPKNGGGTYIRRSLRERATRGTGKVLRFTGTPEFNALTESQRRADIREWLETVVRPELEKLPKNLRHCLGKTLRVRVT